MANASNISWIPADVSVLNFTDCNRAADWYAYYDDIPQYTTADLLIDGLTHYWTEKHMTNGTDPDTDVVLEAYWANGTNRTGINSEITQFLFHKCNIDIYCSKLGFQGNQDLAGRGMFANYVLEAVLVMLYALVLGMHRSGRLNPSGRFGRAISAFKESSRTFLDAAMLFSLVMAVATVYSFSSAIASKQFIIPYAILTSVHMSVWSLIPAIVLHTSTRDCLPRRQKLRKAAWLLISLFVMAMIAMFIFLVVGDESSYSYSYYSSDTDDAQAANNDKQLSFMAYCMDVNQELAFFIVILACFGTIGLFCLFWILLVRNVFRIGFLNNIKFFQWLRRHWWWVISVFGVAAMWGWLGAFIYFRKELSNAKVSGGANMDHEWSFGQILALATFAPVFVEWGFIYIEGPEEGLSGLLSNGFQVVRSNSNKDSTRHLLGADTTYSGVRSDEEMNDL